MQDNPNPPLHQLQIVETAAAHVMPTYEGGPNDLTVGNMAPLIIQLLPRGGPDRFQGPTFPFHPEVQWGFSFHVVHSQHVLLSPIIVRRNFRLFPIVPNVARYCAQCGKMEYQVALETLGDYLSATAYDGETVRDREVCSRAFLDGFEAALFIF